MLMLVHLKADSILLITRYTHTHLSYTASKCSSAVFSHLAENPEAWKSLNFIQRPFAYSTEFWGNGGGVPYPFVCVFLVEKLELWIDATHGEDAILGAVLGVAAGNPEIRRTGVGKADCFRLAGVMEMDLSRTPEFWNTPSSDAFTGVLTAMALRKEHTLTKNS